MYVHMYVGKTEATKSSTVMRTIQQIKGTYVHKYM